ncbi:type III-B CRISPR-associated protein Cas10/Cmr2 [Ignisphaera sp. 4213-co]|uniref:Type III-B CRISPR-associated protein Cas10/Cmr2 n=1 Tax=Ignisphaera cupida TaxID=3050454 RepID=A0ABD4ZB41_9CREN|nr:type III-B CRISPR-associated protein Cas10/Cmr2 [Ignisphaera sp. 4213-co]MDK6029515.1 type III-B CRISPR-associated protein Cas10/Cmr2 [Ignisphaera sp. 4213-co]
MDPYLRLYALKARVLLHDPPNKMWVLRSHEEVARKFVELVLSGTNLFIDVDENAVRRADVAASTFDRWFINYLYAEKSDGGSSKPLVVEYRWIHNIFRPDKRVELSDPGDRVYNVLRGVGDVLREIAEAAKNVGDRALGHLLYTTLYFLLEVSWLSNDLSPSLADTRNPTHTVFDHLYAATTISNLYLYEEPSGFVARIDIPMIQKFVSSARRTADFWAGSWVISKLSWGIIKRFVDEYGPDIVLSPSLRLNPYLFNYIIEKLEEAGVGRNTTRKICEQYSELLKRLGLNIIIEKTGGDCEKLREMLSLIPLIPATTYIVLPPIKFSSVDDVRNTVARYYTESWNDIVKQVMESSEPTRGIGSVLKQLLNEFQNVLRFPHTSIRIDVVDVKNVYMNLEMCLYKGDKNACKQIGLEDSVKEKLEKTLKQETRNGLSLKEMRLANALLWHVVVTKALDIESRKSPIPLPRPFWIFDGANLKPETDYSKLTAMREGDWRLCTLCQEEPAVIHFPKTWSEKRKRPEFDEEWVKLFREYMISKGLEVDDKAFNELKKVFRPGEALGPYCLLKRVIGYVHAKKLRNYFGLASTDDVALIALDKSLAKIIADEDKAKRFREAFEEKAKREGITIHHLQFVLPEAYKRYCEVSKERCEVVEAIEFRDLELAAFSSNMLYDSFKRVISDSLEEFCKDVDPADLAREMLGDNKDFEVLYKAARKTLLAKRLCSIRTRYSIVKGDGDNIGKLHQGDLESLGIEMSWYIDTLVNHLVKNVSKDDAERIRKAYEIASKVANAIAGKNKLVVSPTLSAAISIALQVAALKDVATIVKFNGFPIYAGGDDVLALFPVEKTIQAVEALRTGFWGDNEKMFHLSTGGEAIVVAQALPTGRSFGVRVADVMDVMSFEIIEAGEQLEKIAKNARWLGSDVCISEKDSLVVSDSRSGVVALFPLSICSGHFKKLIASKVLKTLATIFVANSVGVLSSNTPDDLDNALSDPLTKARVELPLNARHKLIENVVSRNIDVGRDAEEVKTKIVNIFTQPIEVIGNCIINAFNLVNTRRLDGENGLTLAEELIEFIRAARGW